MCWNQFDPRPGNAQANTVATMTTLVSIRKYRRAVPTTKSVRRIQCGNQCICVRPMVSRPIHPCKLLSICVLPASVVLWLTGPLMSMSSRRLAIGSIRWSGQNIGIKPLVPGPAEQGHNRVVNLMTFQSPRRPYRVRRPRAATRDAVASGCLRPGYKPWR